MVINHEIPADLHAQLIQMANATGRGESDIVSEALASYLAEFAEFVADVHAGIAEADRGELVDDEVVQARLALRFGPLAP